jgi:hypothetical protein
MNFNAATLLLMAQKGLTAFDIAELAAANEKRADPTAAARQAKRRAKVKSQRDVTRDPLNDISSNPHDTPDEAKASSAPRGKTDRGSRLPDDFQVPDEWIDYAVTKRKWSRADAIEEAEGFCRYWKAKTGAGARKRDWYMTWQNWVANSRRPNGSTAAHSADTADWTPERKRTFLEQISRREATGPPGRPIGSVIGAILPKAATG